jgi:hypothetical protein
VVVEQVGQHQDQRRALCAAANSSPGVVAASPCTSETGTAENVRLAPRRRPQPAVRSPIRTA